MRNARRIRTSFVLSLITCLAIIVGLVYIFSNSSDTPHTSITPQSVTPKLILQYTPIFGAWSNQALESCPLKNVCTITFDKSLIKEADAVVFHCRDLESVSHYPLRTFQGQKHVFYSMESPINEEKYLKKVPG